MQQIPVESSTRVSHGFKPILPGASDELPSACSGCHDDLTTTDLEFLVTDTQEAVRARLAAAQAQLENIPEPAADSPEMERYQQAASALNFVENDGSFGIHNYTYADTLLTAAEQDLSALGGAEAGVTPTALPTPEATAEIESTVVQASVAGDTVGSGIRPITVIVIAGVIGILLIAAFAFFRKSDGGE